MRQQVPAGIFSTRRSCDNEFYRGQLRTLLDKVEPVQGFIWGSAKWWKKPPPFFARPPHFFGTPFSHCEVRKRVFLKLLVLVLLQGNRLPRLRQWRAEIRHYGSTRIFHTWVLVPSRTIPPSLWNTPTRRSVLQASSANMGTRIPGWRKLFARCLLCHQTHQQSSAATLSWRRS